MDQATSDSPEKIDWVVSPAREKPALACFVAGVLVLIGYLVSLFAEDWIWGALAVVFLLATVSRFYLPSRIQVSQTGVRAEFPLRTREAPWDEIEWVRHDGVGALIRTRTNRLFQSAEFTILFGRAGHRVIEGLKAFAPEGVVQYRGGDKEPSP